MKRFFHIAALFFIIPALAMMTSCKDDGDEIKGFQTDPENITFTVEGGNVQVTVYANGQWNGTASDSWVSMSAQTGTGTSIIMIGTLKNNTGEVRSATVTFTSGIEKTTLNIQQLATHVSVDKDKIVFDKEGTPQQLQLTTTFPWSIDPENLPRWLTVSPSSGEGDATLTLTPAPFERLPRDTVFHIVSNRSITKIYVDQLYDNENPYAPEMEYPANDATGIDPNDTFRWVDKGDPDGDGLVFDVLISTDNSDWKTAALNIKGTSSRVAALQDNTTYYWRVVAKDPFGGTTQSADTRKFTTGQASAYTDGEVRYYQTATKGNKPIHLVIIGDGFTEQDYVPGGHFDEHVRKGVDAFFSVHPYPLYRDYFSVTTVAAFSQEEGVSIRYGIFADDFGNPRYEPVQKNTALRVEMNGGGTTAIYLDQSRLEDYLYKIPIISREEMATSVTTLVMVNLKTYAGTAVVMEEGFSYTMCPLGGSYEQIVRHEVSGHGFGRLDDEYAYAQMGTAPEGAKEYVNNMRAKYGIWNYGANITFSGDPEEAPWSHFIGREGYEAVGMVEGGMTYIRGVWRSEVESCMMTNVPYYNAISREAITRRIYDLAGMEFTYEKFWQDEQNAEKAWRGTRTNMDEFVPLHPPMRGTGLTR